MRALLSRYGKKVPCVTRHNFNGVSPLELDASSPAYRARFDAFLHSLDVAAYFNAPLVRTLSFAGSAVIWGYDGADRWFANNNAAWPRMLALLERPLREAADRGITVVVETGVFSIIRTAAMAKRAVEELRADNFKVLWDPANCLFAGELPLEGYDSVRDCLAHVHIKDLACDRAGATIACRPLGKGDMGPWLGRIAAELKRDGYDGVVSFESVFRNGADSFENGYRASVDAFKQLFA